MVSVDYLVMHKAELKIPSESGLTPLQAAIQRGHVSIVERLIDAGCSVNTETRTSPSSSMLHVAARFGQLDVVKLLMKRKADLSAVSEERGMTVLHEAAFRGHVVHKLLFQMANQRFMHCCELTVL